MPRAKFVLVSAMMGLSLLPAIARGADKVYLKVEAKTQGTLKGEVKRISGDNYIAVLKYNYEVISPRDSATGLPSGKRQHTAVVITKALDSTSPQLFQALVTNEDLKQVTIEFTTSTADGKEITDFTVQLTNATVSDIHQHMNQVPAGAPSDLSLEPMEDVSFTFQSIAVTSSVGQTTATDAWAAPTN